MTSWALSLGLDRAPLHAPSDAAAGGNGVYRYGPSGFPDQSWNATSYWVDAVFSQTPPADTRAPKVTSVTPGAGGHRRCPVSSNVKVSFDEPLAASSVSGSSLTLKDDQGAAVAAERHLRRPDPDRDAHAQPRRSGAG